MQKFNQNIFKEFNNLLGVKTNYSKIEKQYLDKSCKYIKFIKYLPGIRLIAVGNSLAMKAANKSSDIDLFIVTTPNSMRINRFLITLFFTIFNQRKTSKKHAGKFCLSFFITENNLNLENIAIKNDIYLYFWIVYLKPILSYNNTYENFINQNSLWADFSEYKKIILDNKKYIKYFGIKKKNNYKITEIFDKIIKKIFLTKTLKTYKKLGKPFGVIINDDMLKFHNNDLREKIKTTLIK